jgi:hypothetical protein
LRPLVESGQYTSQAFAQLCTSLGVMQSMGAVGTSAVNALAESFNASLKRETLRGAPVWPDHVTCRRSAVGVQVGEPLQHPPSSLLLRSAGTHRLRTATRRCAAVRRIIDHPVSTIRGQGRLSQKMDCRGAPAYLGLSDQDLYCARWRSHLHAQMASGPCRGSFNRGWCNDVLARVAGSAAGLSRSAGPSGAIHGRDG